MISKIYNSNKIMFPIGSRKGKSKEQIALMIEKRKEKKYQNFLYLILEKQKLMRTLEELYSSTVVEREEHKKSKEYKKLSPKMKEAVDQVFTVMDAKPSDFLNTFEKTIQSIAKKFKVPEKTLMSYFEREMLSI